MFLEILKRNISISLSIIIIAPMTESTLIL